MQPYTKDQLAKADLETGWYWCKWTKEAKPTVVRVSPTNFSSSMNLPIYVVHEGRDISWFHYPDISLYGPIEPFDF
jgi:hypothetical protein